MGVRTNLLGVTLLTAEVSTGQADGVDMTGMLADAETAIADAIRVLNVMIEFIPSGSNKTTLQTQVTSLT